MMTACKPGFRADYVAAALLEIIGKTGLDMEDDGYGACIQRTNTVVIESGTRSRPLRVIPDLASQRVIAYQGYAVPLVETIRKFI